MQTQHHIEHQLTASAGGAQLSDAPDALQPRSNSPDTRSPKFDEIPLELKAKANWVVWRLEGKPGAKPIKMPYDPKMLNSRAKSNDLETWGTYEQAEAAFMEGGYTGVGFMLNGDGVVGIDIDHCVTNGVPSAASMDLMQQLDVTYIEISPSGTGLRGFGYAQNLEKGVNGALDGLKVELYSNLRFLTVTGHTLSNGGLGQLTGFTELAAKVRKDSCGNGVERAPEGVLDDRHAVWISQILSGEVYHDTLRDLAGSMVATGMQPGAVVVFLRGLMQKSCGPRNERWRARNEEISKLVDSAVNKFSPNVVDVSRIVGVVQAKQEAAANDDAPKVTRFKVLSAAAVAKSAPIAWTIRGLLPKTGLAALYGASGSGKSFLALDLSASVAAAVAEWYGKRVTACPVTYCVLEGEAGMGKRIAAWEAHYQKASADNLRFIVQPFDITSPADVEELALAIRAAKGADGLIVLDTLNRAAPGADENSSKDMGVIIANAKALQQIVGGMVLLVHHSGKDESKGMRGHSSLFAAMDAVLYVSNSKDKGLSWGIGKSKDDETGSMHPFRLEQVVVGIDDEGEEITSCVAVSVAPSFAQRGARKLGPHQRTARDVLLAMFNAAPDKTALAYSAAYDAIADMIEVDPKHKRERAKQAMLALASYGMVELTETHIVRLAALG